MSSPKLLFVDDEPGIRVTLGEILRREGFDVTVAANIGDALQLISQQEFDILISDLNIGQPGDGFTIVSAMRRVQPRAITFILTGYPDFETALQAIRNQVDDYLIKPADARSLVRTIKQRLATNQVAHRPPKVRRVSQVIGEHADAITTEWLEAVHQDWDLAAIPLSREARIDHVALLLSQLIVRVDTEAEANTPEAVDAARQHGETRYRQGYSVPMLVREAHLLQRVIIHTLQANLIGIDLSTLIPDMLRIGEALADMLQESVRAFVALKEKELAA